MILSVDTASMNEIAKRILENADNYLIEYEKLRSNLETYSSWTGADSAAYRQKASELFNNLKKMVSQLHQTNNSLEFVAIMYKQASEDAVNKAKQI